MKSHRPLVLAPRIHLLWLLLISGISLADPQVDIQLRWLHQFQFAGYYAALEKGFYREEGVDVRLHAGAPDRLPVDQLISGHAEYAVGSNEVVYQRLLGKPLVALAAVLQHSPSALLVRGDSGIRSVHDLIGKRVMLLNSVKDADFMSILFAEGIKQSQIEVIPSSYDINDLIEGRVDAFSSYMTNEPFFFMEKGIDYRAIDSQNYQVDFYGDIFFTSEHEIEDHPERVAAVLRATLKGWRYAMDHPEEIIDLLIEKYGVKKSREHLRYEAETLRQYILPDLIEVGHMNPGRFQHMADTMINVGLVKPGVSLDGFVYSAKEHRLPKWVMPVLAGMFMIMFGVTVAAVYYRRLVKSLSLTESKLRSANSELAVNFDKIAELHLLLEDQATRDPLTDLFNRRYLDETLDRELARAGRTGEHVSLAIIDIDHFKCINDTEGHQAGDKVLKILADILTHCAREGDVPCRYGGDEFVLVLPGLDEKGAVRRADDWRSIYVKKVSDELNLQFDSSLSIGIGVYPDHCSNSAELINCADRALYYAKEGGRDRVVVCQGRSS